MAETIRKNDRRSVELDLLRILSMLLIILMHSIDHTGVLEASDRGGYLPAFMIRFLYMLTQISVNCYVMLSGYFLVRSRFRLQKLAALWLETVFYAFSIKLVFMLAGEADFSLFSLAGCLFPFLTGRYWFITIYVGMYFLSPFLNLAVRSMDKRQHGLLLLTLALLFSAWSSIHPAIAGMNSGGGWGLAWFVVLYLTAAWFRLYSTKRMSLPRGILSWLLISALAAAVYIFPGRKLDMVRSIAGTWYHYNSFPAFLATCLVFLAFRDLRIHSERLSRPVCFVAPSTLGVYLIHEHANLSPFLWGKLDLPAKMGSPWFLFVQIGAVIAIFAVCTLMDLVRRFTIGQFETSSLIKSFCLAVERKGAALIDLFFPNSQ